MDYIVIDRALDIAKAESAEQVLEKLLNNLQEVADALTPKTNIRHTLAGIRRKIENDTITSDDLINPNAHHILNMGSWQEQTERTHTLACIYAAMAQIRLKNNDTISATMAILEAATFNGLAQGFSHHRKTNASNRARKGGLTKASIHQEKIEKLLELLVHDQPSKGWPNISSTVKALTPNYKKFLTEALKRPTDSDENVQTEILELLENNKIVKEKYKSLTMPKIQPPQ